MCVPAKQVYGARGGTEHHRCCCFAFGHVCDLCESEIWRLVLRSRRRQLRQPIAIVLVFNRGYIKSILFAVEAVIRSGFSAVCWREFHDFHCCWESSNSRAYSIFLMLCYEYDAIVHIKSKKFLIKIQKINVRCGQCPLLVAFKFRQLINTSDHQKYYCMSRLFWWVQSHCDREHSTAVHFSAQSYRRLTDV